MNTAAIADTHTTYTLRDTPSGSFGPYKAVTAKIGLWQGLHLISLHELTATRPEAECGARAHRLNVTVTDEVPEGEDVCEECHLILTTRGI